MSNLQLSSFHYPFNFDTQLIFIDFVFESKQDVYTWDVHYLDLPKKTWQWLEMEPPVITVQTTVLNCSNVSANK